MNTKTKRRLVVVTLVIVLVAAVTFAYAGASGAARSVSVAEAASGQYADQRIEVSGTVVDGSFSMTGNTLRFTIYDPTVGAAPSAATSRSGSNTTPSDGGSGGSGGSGNTNKANDANSPQPTTLEVIYEGAAATTFGSGVVAICTGKIDAAGILHASELVTKCPSKYESAEGAVTADYLIKQGSVLAGKELRLAGYVKPGTLVAAGTDERFVLYSQGAEVSVRFDGALSAEVADDVAVVCTGTLNEAGVFVATDVALKDIN